MRQERNITNLLSPDTRVYIWFSTRDTALAFLEQAESEGFTFADGASPTSKEPDDILVINDDLTINYLGFAGRVAYKNVSENNGKLYVRIDYRRYCNGEANYYVDMQVGNYACSVRDDTYDNSSIGSGTAAVIVYDDDLRNKAIFFDWLRAEGFNLWRHSKGWFDGVCWVYINIDSKLYARGIPGIPITRAFGRHAITIREFQDIYGIFKKYENLSPLRFE